MAETYTVNYNIKVNGVEQAAQALNKFQTSLQALNKASTELKKFETKLNKFMTTFNKIGKAKIPTLKINTGTVNKQLDGVINKLNTINRLAGKKVVMHTGASSAGSSSKGSGGGGTSVVAATGKAKPTRAASARRTAARPMVRRGNAAYRALGPSMIDSGGIGAVDMLKGMGIAYGISGLGSLVGNVISDATAYDNLITTTKNILKTHDKRDNFDSRFDMMQRVIRNVGVETKFTAPEVADASKFLAMAGFDLESINKSIRPIADIALVGDTELGETADVVTNIMTGYGIKPQGLRHAADVMANTFTMSNTTLMEIAESYKYAASLLSAGGVSFEEATAGIGILGDAGIKGSQAGTTMRTIMANIVNPTKKQKAVWDKIGIQRFGADGKVRDLVDIFADLNNAGLSVEQFYQMFHRTAAQGAVALTANVQKWNDVIKENFLSDGITEELAKAKKNTIAGLWAQLTSMFTENGMQSFESLDAQIRGFLQETINWLKTPEANKFFKDLGQAFFDMVKMMKEFTMKLVDLFQKFKPFITMWIELQLKLSAVLIPLRIFRGLIGFGAYVRQQAASLGSLSLQFNNLTASVTRFTGVRGALAGTWANIANIGRMSTTGWVSRGMLGGGMIGNAIASDPRFQGKSQDVINRYNRRYYVTPVANGAAMYGGGFGSMAGAALGMYAGSQFGEEGSTTSMLGTIGGMMAGGALGNMVGAKAAPWLATKALPFLLTNPVGWGIAVAGGLGYAAYSFIKYKQEVDDANEANNKFLASTASINGISLSEHATMADKYLSIIYDKQMSTNRAIGEHINLMREQLGLMNSAEKELSDKKLKEDFKDKWDDAYKAFAPSFFSSTSDKREAATSAVMLPNGIADFGITPRAITYLDGNGKSHSAYAFNGLNFEDNEYGYSQLAAARFLTAMGRDLSAGSELQNIQQQYNKRFLMSGSIEDFTAVLKDTNNAMLDKTKIIPGSQGWNMKELGDKTEADWRRGYHYVYGHNAMVSDMFAWDRPTASANAQMLSDLVTILQNLASGNISDEMISNFMLHSGIQIFDASKYGAFGSPEFMRQFGWYNNQWNAGSYPFFNKDTGKMETINVTANEAQQAFLLFHQQIIDLTNKMNPKLRQYFNSFLDNPIWNFGGTGNGANGKATLDGVDYEWNWAKNVWQPTGYNGPVVLPDLTNTEMQDRLKNTVGGGATGAGGNGGNGGNTTPTGNPGPKASDYKNHYSNNAVPKQVNVTIKNLMNVDSIDLTNADNAAVIANVKQQLAQALVDVVHDFDETWNG